MSTPSEFLRSPEGQQLLSDPLLRSVAMAIVKIHNEVEDRKSTICESIVDIKVLESLFPGQAQRYYNAFLNLYDDYGEERVADVYHRLTHDEPKVDQSTLDQLRQIEGQANKSVPRKVQRARDMVDNLILETDPGKTLRERSSAVLVYGSTQFCDPAHLDLDIQIITDTRVDTHGVSASDKDFRMLDNTLVKVWRAGGHITAYNIADRENLDIDGLDVILAGRLVLVREGVDFSKLQEEARAVAESDRFLCASLNASLAECLKKRLSRRQKS